MGKILSWIVLGVLGYLAWRLVVLLQRKSTLARGAGAQGRGKALQDERILPCAHCGVHFPASEAVVEGKLHFCCADHRNAHRSG